MTLMAIDSNSAGVAIVRGCGCAGLVSSPSPGGGATRRYASRASIIRVSRLTARGTSEAARSLIR